MLFGAIHAFFWSGDILFIYGAIGFIFILFRNLPAGKLLSYAIGFFYVWLAYDMLFAIFFPDFMRQNAIAYKTYPDLLPWDLTNIFQYGTFSEVLHANWHNLAWRYFDLIPAGRPTKVLALFLLGYYMMKSDFFRKHADNAQLFFRFFISGTIITALALWWGGSMASFPHSLRDTAWKATAATGQLLLALSYIQGIVVLYHRKEWVRKLLHPLSYVGRMSFTNYVLHTFFGYLIFYPFLGGLFGKMSLLGIMITAVCIFLFEIIISYYWLKYFRFGPLEWLWRCLTYKRYFPLRREKSTS